MSEQNDSLRSTSDSSSESRFAHNLLLTVALLFSTMVFTVLAHINDDLLGSTFDAFAGMVFAVATIARAVILVKES